MMPWRQPLLLGKNDLTKQIHNLSNPMRRARIIIASLLFALLAPSALAAPSSVCDDTSSKILDRNDVPADNTTVITLTVIARGCAFPASPVAGATVTVSTTFGGVTITPGSTTTNTSGIATFAIKSSAMGSATLSITANGTVFSMGVPMPHFVPNNVSVPDSSITVIQNNMIANNFATNRVRVSARNSFGGPIGNASVTLASSRSGDDTITPNPGTANSDGDAYFDLISCVPGGRTV